MAYTYMIQHAGTWQCHRQGHNDRSESGLVSARSELPSICEISRVASKDILMVSFPTLRFLLCSTWTTVWFPIT